MEETKDELYKIAQSQRGVLPIITSKANSCYQQVTSRTVKISIVCYSIYLISPSYWHGSLVAFLAYTYLLQTSGDAKQRLTFRESDCKLGPRSDLMASLVASMHDLRAEFKLDEDQTRSRRNSEPTIDVCIVLIPYYVRYWREMRRTQDG